MDWKEYEPKKEFRRVITNTFSSNEDYEMFIMVLNSSGQNILTNYRIVN